MGLDYGWGNDEMTLDFEGSKIVRVKVADLDEATAALLADPDGEKFTDRVLQFKGADTFALPGFTKEVVSRFFTAGYTATFTIEYYAKAGTMSVVAINGDTTREIVAADKFEEGVHTISFDYTVAEGDTGIAFVTTGEAEFYFGRLGVILYAGGPSYNQLAAGYTFNWAQLPVDGKDYGTAIQVKDITDETAKAAIIASGKTEDDFAALVETYSGDGGSKYNGGLYSHVMEGQMVEGFNEWIFDANRKSGDCEIVKTKFGYHLIYFVEKDELNYRDYMIDVNMRSEAAAEWLDEMVENAKIGEKDISKLDLDFVISPSTYY
jgi:hypothetical protein